jgi:DNA (cytosine-5)-methyltransferase 1
MIRFIDLFAGLGGFHLAASSLGAKCVFAAEIDDELRRLYLLNFGMLPAGDLREISIEDIPRHDLLCAGFPCQPFSKAGEQAGCKDKERGTLFKKILEIVDRHRPRFIILENVAHFVRHNDGSTYNKITSSLRSMGYCVDSRQLSPHAFGIPQIRERMYLVAHCGGAINFRWPHEETNVSHLNVRSVLDSNPDDAAPISAQALRCLEVWQEFLELVPNGESFRGWPLWSEETGATYPITCDSLLDVPLRELRRCRGAFGASMNCDTREDILARVPSYARRNEGSFPIWKRKFITKNRDFFRRNSKVLRQWIEKVKAFPPSLQKFEWHGDGRKIWDHIIQFRASGVRVKRPTTSPSLVAMTTSQVPIIGWEKRYMTVRECARLQSMDALKQLPTGRTAVRAMGNAVNVKVVALILRELLKRNGRRSNFGPVGATAHRNTQSTRNARSAI